MSDRVHEKKIEELLSGQKDREAPEWLSSRIVKRVGALSVPVMHRLIARVYSQQPMLRFASIVMVSISLLLLGAIGGISYKASITEKSKLTKVLLRFETNTMGRVNYHLGRALMAAGELNLAEEIFAKTAEQEPGAQDAWFWLGVSKWMIGDLTGERESYLRSISAHSEHLPSLINLGHNYLVSGEYHKALLYYEKALSISSGNPGILYNRALAYRLMNQSEAAQGAFQKYIKDHRTGKWADRALNHLRQLGDFSYRRFKIGPHMTIIDTGALLIDPGANTSEIGRLAKLLDAIPEFELHLVVFRAGKLQRAKADALRLKQNLMSQMGNVSVSIRTSWFDVPERLVLQNGEVIFLDNSLMVFTRGMKSIIHRSST